MKKAIFILSIIAAFAVSNQAAAQNEKKQNNGTFEILDVYAPDFVAFKVAEGKQIKEVEVYFVSETQSFKGGNLRAKPVDIAVDDKGTLLTTYTDKTEIRIMNFNTPSTGFEATRIKFVADGQEMYYDIAKAEWEMELDKE